MEPIESAGQGPTAGGTPAGAEPIVADRGTTRWFGAGSTTFARSKVAWAFGLDDDPDLPAGEPLAAQSFDPAGRYLSEGFQARGGIGQVWRAHDQMLGRTVALKELRDDHTGLPGWAAWFEREAKVTAQLEHPSIVTVHDLGVGCDGRGFYTMRLVEGRTLSDAVRAYHLARRRGKGESRVLRELIGAVATVARAVAYAHSRGVIHRDLKPSNVILGAFGEVSLLDWGLASVRGGADVALARMVVPDPEFQAELAETLAGKAVGTFPYMPPEQAQPGGRPAGAAADVFGLGAILYEVLAGRAPLPTARSLETYREALGRGIERPGAVAPGVPRALEAVCLKALQADPAARHAGARELADDLACWLADEPVSAWREPWTDRLARWVRHNRGKAGAIATFGLALAAALAVGLAVSEQARQAADVAKGRAERARQDTQAANDRLRLALEESDVAVGAMLQSVDELDAVAGSHLAHLPGMIASRRKLARTALDHLEKVQARGTGRRDVTDRRVTLLRELALLDRLERDFVGATTLLDRAENVVVERGGPMRGELALVLYDRATVDWMRGRLDAAEQSNARGLEILDALGNAPERERGVRMLRAEFLTQRGELRHELGRIEESVADFQAAEALWQMAERADDLTGDGPLQRCMSQGAFVRVLRDAGRTDDAEAESASGVERARALAASAPGDNNARELLAEALEQRARTLTARGGTALPDAEASATEAVAIARRLADAFTDIAIYRLLLAETLDALGDARAAADPSGPPREEHREADSLLALLLDEGDAVQAAARRADVRIDLLERDAAARADAATLTARLGEVEVLLDASRLDARRPDVARTRHRIETLRVPR